MANGSCETCMYKDVCVYPHRPTECANHRKLRMNPDAVECPECNGSGYGAYPLICTKCYGCGAALPTEKPA